MKDLDKITGNIKPQTDTEKKCLSKNCPHFVCWDYYGCELHSCALQGESNDIIQPAKDERCLIKSECHG